jgi:hypothetical protein
MKILFAVYKHGSEDQTLIALFELEKEALKCKDYLENIKIYAEYEGFYIQEENQYDSFSDYLIDVKSS